MTWNPPIDRKQRIEMRVWDLETRAENADREKAEEAKKTPGCLMSLFCTLLFLAALLAVLSFIITVQARLERMDHLTFKQVMDLPKEPEAVR